MVSFTGIPANLLVPGFWAEFDASAAQQGPSIQTYRILALGQKLAAGTVAELVPKTCTSADQVGEYFGRGSMLHGMAIALFANNRFTSATFVAIDDAAASVAATQTVVVAGTATEAGTVALYCAGRRVTATVASGDAATAVRDALVAAITADDTIPFTAAAGTGGGDIDLTARNKGTRGNQLDVRHSYNAGEALPAGITLTVPGFSSGATDPDISEFWAVLGETQYNVIANPWTDATNLTALNTELEERWGPIRAIEGVAISAIQDTHANLLTAAASQKTRKLWSIMGYASAPTPDYEWAAAIAGVVAGAAQADPGRPFQTLELKGVLGPETADDWTVAERNLLLLGGVATYKIDGGGAVRIERLVSTWSENPQGGPDTTFRDINPPLTLGYLRFDLRAQMLASYPRHKLGNDGTRYGAGQPVVTPREIEAKVVAIAQGWAELALIEDLDTFAANLVVERNATDPNRLDLLLPPDIINQFRVGAASIQFLL